MPILIPRHLNAEPWLWHSVGVTECKKWSALFWCEYVIYITQACGSREALHLFIHSFAASTYELSTMCQTPHQTLTAMVRKMDQTQRFYLFPSHIKMEKQTKFCKGLISTFTTTLPRESFILYFFWTPPPLPALLCKIASTVKFCTAGWRVNATKDNAGTIFR